MNLPLHSAAWSFRAAGKRSAWKAAVVPGCIHQDLLRLGLIPPPFVGKNELLVQWIEEQAWEYRGIFTLTAEDLTDPAIELVADGLDSIATVTLNQAPIAQTENMFVGYRWPVKKLLRKGRNELRVTFQSAVAYVRTHRQGHRIQDFHDPVGGATRIRKQQCQFGWDWGPRLVTCGIWRDIRLEGGPINRLVHVRVEQEHRRAGSVTLRFFPEFSQGSSGVTWEGEVRYDGKLVANIDQRGIAIVSAPRLWWPNGQGAQPLYTVSLSARSRTGQTLGSWTRKIGLRTIALDRHADRWGETFQFVVNGRAIFAKGANWVPAHAFVAGLGRTDYERDLGAAAAAHMNMIRAWGGGIYESEHFYDLCDELGLLVWQDFMFACSRYPADPAFLRSVTAEANYQVRRLQHRACLALWCGNNEIPQLNEELLSPGRARREYERLFHRTLPTAVRTHDGITPYWPSSQWRGSYDRSHAMGERRGDTHYWDVWHARRPVKEYEKWQFRFVSEFGMQSYSSPATNATFCAPGDANVFGSAMEHHQKNRHGNQIILDYVSVRYRFPKSQDALIYLSQLNQAHCMATGVEHWRRHQPRCRGALYWQLNDCWPVASWSSIEFTGRWKALHHFAQRFFAPAIVSGEVVGDEAAGPGNYRRSTVSGVKLHTVFDGPQPLSGRLTWTLYHLDGRILREGAKPVRLRPQTSQLQQSIDLRSDLKQHGSDHLYLRIALATAAGTVSEDSVLLAPPRFLPLRKARTEVRVKRLSPTQAELTFVSDQFQHRLAFEFIGRSFTASDNWFDLFPRREKQVLVECERPFSSAELRRRLRFQSLVDTYE